jgi:flagellar motor switch protein FliN/FliY
MTPAEAEQMENTPEAAGSDFEQTLAGVAAEAAFSQAMNGDEPLDAAGETGEAEASPEGDHIDNSALIAGLPVMMKVVLGSAKMPVATLAKLAKGSVVKLDTTVGDPDDILVNGRLIARGEVVVLNEGKSRFGVVLTQVGGLARPQK